MKKNSIAQLFLLVAISLLVACSTTNENTKPALEFQLDSQTDAKTNFDGIKTFGWLAAAAAVNDPSGKWNPPNVDFGSDLKFLIEREMKNRGINSAAENPDVQVLFLVAIDMDAVKVVEGRFEEGEEERLESLPQGAIVVQMLDTETGKALWTAGIAAEILENPTAEQTRERLDLAVTELFKTYPAKK